MFEWFWPWALAALPLPLLARWLLPAASAGAGALRLPFLDEAVACVSSSRVGRWRLAGLFAWILLCAAAARPQWVDEVEVPPRSGRDLLLAVDVSGSMAIEDMRIGGRVVDRLSAVKTVVGDFLARRAGDRVGLLLFGQQAYLLTPLTFDLGSVRYQLETSSIGIAGRETAIGDAIGLAVKRLREREQGERVLILLTDGVNTAGSLQPLEATELAMAQSVRIHTIGVGGEARRGMLGMLLQQPEDIDEPTLRAIAERTGGRYFRARNTQELAGIYAEIDRLEPMAQQGEPLRPRRELFVWPLAAALILGLLVLAWYARPRAIDRLPEVAR